MRYQEIVDRVLEIMCGRTDKPIHIAEISRTAGVSPRTLSRAFQAVHGVTPCRHLRALRLSEARRMLSSADGEPGTVTEVATRFGFVELGRFAVAYRSAFGESPSATLHRSSESRRQKPSSSAARKSAVRSLRID